MTLNIRLRGREMQPRKCKFCVSRSEGWLDDGTGGRFLHHSLQHAHALARRHRLHHLLDLLELLQHGVDTVHAEHGLENRRGSGDEQIRVAILIALCRTTEVFAPTLGSEGGVLIPDARENPPSG